jgi:N-acetylneuraminic acid mutarotase
MEARQEDEKARRQAAIDRRHRPTSSCVNESANATSVRGGKYAKIYANSLFKWQSRALQWLLLKGSDLCDACTQNRKSPKNSTIRLRNEGVTMFRYIMNFPLLLFVLSLCIMFSAIPTQAQPVLNHVTAELSSGRYDLTATSVGSKAFFAGGRRPDAVDTIDIYDITLNQWSVSHLSNPRANLASTTVGDKAFFAGGARDAASNLFSDVVDIYDDGTGQWSQANLSQARSSLAAASCNGKGYFAGGIVATNAGYPSLISNVVDVYDAVNDQWSTLTMPHARYDFAIAAVDSKLLFVGGGPSVNTEADIYDTQTGVWSTVALTSESGRRGIASAVVDGAALFVGGISSSQYVNDIDMYNSASGIWTTSQLPAKTGNMAGTALGQIALFGGGAGLLNYDTVYIFDSTTDTWSQTSLSDGRADLAATSVGDTAIFAGGYGGHDTARVDMYTYIAPEPSTLVLFGVGSICFLVYAWCKAKTLCV